MLTKAQTSREMVFPFFPQGERLTPFMRACALWATLEEHDKILDMACGSGALLSFLNDRYRLTLCGMCDSPEQARAVRQRLEDADVISARLEDIPWRGEIFHAVLLPVLLRGEEMRQALSEAYRVLRYGGRFFCLEFSTTTWPGFKEAYDLYSHQLVPRIGQAIAGDAESYRYLVESIRRFPSMPEFEGMIRKAGFVRTKVEPIMAGLDAIHSGWKAGI